MQIPCRTSCQAKVDRESVDLRRVVILGSTGSIGVQTLEVIEHLNSLHQSDRSVPRFQVVGLAAGSNQSLIEEQAHRFDVQDIALCNTQSSDSQFSVRVGEDAATRLVEEVECDIVVGAIVGIAGLQSVMRAVELGTDVALANKETLVAAGSLVVDTALRTGAQLLPVDSEHAGVWQCAHALMGQEYSPPVKLSECVDRVVLTASGGPFYQKSRAEIENACIKDALNHPNWSMGQKVTIDSATLMNKALELIEAHWLFGLRADQLGAVIHPQSIVHAFIECADRSVLAQLGVPDMKAPIQYALCAPNRFAGCSDRLDVTKLAQMDFVEIDLKRFPSISLAMEVIQRGGTSGASLNAANERAVQGYLAGDIPFGYIDQLVVEAMIHLDVREVQTLDDVYAADAEAREYVDHLISQSAGKCS